MSKYKQHRGATRAVRDPERPIVEAILELSEEIYDARRTYWSKLDTARALQSEADQLYLELAAKETQLRNLAFKLCAVNNHPTSHGGENVTDQKDPTPTAAQAHREEDPATPAPEEGIAPPEGAAAPAAKEDADP